MADLVRNGKKKRTVRRALYGPGAFLIACAALIFLMSIFFRVSSVEVRDNSYYTSEEVEDASGIIDGDKVLAVCGSDMKRRGKLSGGTIVATVMSNLGLHEFCRENGVGLVCTSVGDRNVLEKMNECGYKLGGEQSGHTIFTDYATTGDGQLTALQFLDVLARSGKKASELASVCPQYPQVLLNVAVSHERGVKDAIMASDALSAAIAEEEGKLSGEGRVLVRPSGTEALIRVMVEAKTEQIALLAAENLVNVIKML